MPSTRLNRCAKLAQRLATISARSSPSRRGTSRSPNADAEPRSPVMTTSPSPAAAPACRCRLVVAERQHELRDASRQCGGGGADTAVVNQRCAARQQARERREGHMDDPGGNERGTWPNWTA